MNVSLALRENNIDRYVAEIHKFPVLSREEELTLARRYHDTGDIEAAHKLVVSNLRFVVKIAHEYKGYGLKLLDLIQEGNVGLMLAVKKYEPERGYRLISYAVWLIRAYIRNFILRTWSFVRLGTTQASRKLFFKLRSTRSQLEQENEGVAPSSAELAKALNVPEAEVLDMEMRLAGRDFSLDAATDEDRPTRGLDRLPSPNENQEERLARLEDHALVEKVLASALDTLTDKERDIIERRILNEDPETLQQIGDRLGVSRERVRQLENRALKKLRKAMTEPTKNLPSSPPRGLTPAHPIHA